MKSVQSLLLMVIELILIVAVLAGLTGVVLDYLDNLSATLVASGQPMGSLLASNNVGGILWFVLCILLVVGIIFYAVKSAKGGKNY